MTIDTSDRSFYVAELPIRAVNESNTRGHWAPRHRRTRSQREAVALLVKPVALPRLPVVVTLTRIAPRTLDEGDNLPISMKGTRDQIAAIYGVDDRDPRITWKYGQEKRPKTYAVRIEVVAAAGGDGGKGGDNQ